MIEFVSPTLDYALLAPILIVLGGAVLGVLIEAFAPRKSRASSHYLSLWQLWFYRWYR